MVNKDFLIFISACTPPKLAPPAKKLGLVIRAYVPVGHAEKSGA